jgi:putative ABC transport system permease protein
MFAPEPEIWLLKPIAKDLSHVVAASLGRQQKVITRGVILVILAISFAVSTSVFNTTYNTQSIVDAQLTNGDDVVISGSSSANVGANISEFHSHGGQIRLM